MNVPGEREMSKVELNVSQLEKRVTLHRVFAESFKKQLARLLGDELRPEDLIGIGDSTLCLSFMMLEAVERRLTTCLLESEARQELKFLLDSVEKNGHALLEALNNAALGAGFSQEYREDKGFLEYEEMILQKMKGSAES